MRGSLVPEQLKFGQFGIKFKKKNPLSASIDKLLTEAGETASVRKFRR